MTPAELAEFGSVQHRLVPAVKAVTGVQRVYFLALMERAPHFRLWLVPKKDEGELRGEASRQNLRTSGRQVTFAREYLSAAMISADTSQSSSAYRGSRA